MMAPAAAAAADPGVGRRRQSSYWLAVENSGRDEAGNASAH
jgi:hypothetical protein